MISVGLGLYALAKRVDAVGGKCGARGRYDGKQGCVFWFTIPYQPILKGDSGYTDGDNASGDLSCGDIKKETLVMLSTHSISSVGFQMNKNSLDILLVEDSRLIQKTTTRMLTDAKHSVTVSSNGAECLQLLQGKDKSFDVILMDIQMPVLDGIETIKQIRKHEALTGRRPQFVVGVSANSDSDTRQAALDAGMDDFVGKPLSVEILRKCCQKNGISAMAERPLN